MNTQESTPVNGANKTTKDFIWSFARNGLNKIVSFIVTLVLARILMPEEYGIIAIVTVLIVICDVFITSGLPNTLIRRREVDETDFSTVFYFGIIFAAAIYCGVYFAAPLVASIYEYEALTAVIRAMSVTVIISSIKSVPLSLASRNQDNKKLFLPSFCGIIVSAAVGITLAYMGFGVWALVAQYLSNNLVDTVILWIISKWYPKLKFSFSRLRILFSEGWKYLASDLLMALTDELRTIIIGKVYTSDDLAYYQKGRQFPNLVATTVNSSISVPLFAALSKNQDNKRDIRNATSRFIKTGSYLLMPVMVGLAVVAEPMVRFLLTEKWMECVPYLQLLCIGFAFIPIQSANVQACAAMKPIVKTITEIIKRSVNIIVLILTFRISVMAMVIGEVSCTVASLVVNTVASKKLFDYGTFAQIKDIAPYILASVAMGAAIWPISLIGLPDILTIIIQVALGIAVYLLISVCFKLDSFRYILNKIKPILNRRKNND